MKSYIIFFSGLFLTSLWIKASGFSLSVNENVLERSQHNGIVQSYSNMLKGVTPSVVSIYVKRQIEGEAVKVVRNQTEEIFNNIQRRLRKPTDSTAPRLDQKEIPKIIDEGTGSGFIVTEDGFVVTNYHVVQGKSKIDLSRTDYKTFVSVKLNDGRDFEAEIIGTDPGSDLAVLRIKSGESFPAVTFGVSKQTEVGDIVFAIGNPMQVGMTVSMGIVSALNRSDLGIIDRSIHRNYFDKETFALEDFIQTDAAINQGNSGGPLIDSEGRVIGVNSALSSVSGGSIGIGFSIPSDIARKIITEIVETGQPQRGSIGASTIDIEKSQVAEFGLQSTQGARIELIQPNSPADNVGLNIDDIVLTINGELVNSSRNFRYLISNKQPGETVVLEVLRSGQTLTFPITLDLLEYPTMN